VKIQAVTRNVRIERQTAVNAFPVDEGGNQPGYMSSHVAPWCGFAGRGECLYVLHGQLLQNTMGAEYVAIGPWCAAQAHGARHR